MSENSAELPNNIAQFPGSSEATPQEPKPEKHSLLSWFSRKKDQPTQVEAPDPNPLINRFSFKEVTKEGALSQVDFPYKTKPQKYTNKAPGGAA